MNNMWMVEEILEEVRSMARMYSKAVTRCENEASNLKMYIIHLINLKLLRMNIGEAEQ